jgi:hypothetical protein
MDNHEVAVRIDGQSERSGPLTTGQADMLAWASGGTEQTNISVTWDAVGATVDEVVHALETIVERHETLRTTYRVGPEPVQFVAGVGTVTVELHESDRDVATFAEELGGLLAEKPFDHEKDWPIRAAIVIAAGRPSALALVLSHVAVDMAAVAIVQDEWAASLAGRPLPPVGLQPLDVALLERSPAGRQRISSAARHWETQLRRAPRATFPVPGADGPGPPQPALLIQSRRAATALLAIAARTRASRSSAVLAAVCGLIGHYVGQRACLLTSVSANRFRPDLRNVVAPLSQDALMAVALDAPTFDQLVARVQQTAMFAYAKGSDVTTMADAIDRVGRDRGTTFDRDVEFNDHSGLHHSVPPSRATPTPGAETQLTWFPADALDARLTVWLFQLDDILEVCVWADPRVLPRPVAEAFAAGLVAILEAAAAEDVPMARLGELSGLDPVVRGPRWRCVDGSWIDFATMDSLVAEAAAGRRTHVAMADGRIECFVSGDGELTPEVLHDAIMAALPGRSSAMAPHHYVVCRGAPGDLEELDGWRSQARICEGSGRAGDSDPE